MVLEDRVRFWKYVEDTPIGSCWLWNGYQNSKGYGMFTIHRKMYLAHRVSWEMYNGPILYDKQHVLHRCDTPLCVNPGHLFLGTHQQNVRDMVNKGRQRFDPVTLGVVLTEQKVRDMRAEYTGKFGSISALARKYKVNYYTAFRVVHRKTWKRV